MKIWPVNSLKLRRTKLPLQLNLRIGVVDLFWTGSRQDCGGVKLDEISSGFFTHPCRLHIYFNKQRAGNNHQGKRIKKNASFRKKAAGFVQRLYYF